MTNDQPDGQAAEALAAAILTPDAPTIFLCECGRAWCVVCLGTTCPYCGRPAPGTQPPPPQQCEYVTTYQVGGVGGDREGHRCEAPATVRWVCTGNGIPVLLCGVHDNLIMHSPTLPDNYRRVGAL